MKKQVSIIFLFLWSLLAQHCHQSSLPEAFSEPPIVATNLESVGAKWFLQADFKITLKESRMVVVKVYAQNGLSAEPLFTETKFLQGGVTETISVRKELESSDNWLETERKYHVVFTVREIDEVGNEKNASVEVSLLTPREPKMKTDTDGRYLYNSYEDSFTKRDSFEDAATIYYPTNNIKAPYPVALVTHGYNSSKEGFLYLGKHFASHGYVAVLFTTKQKTKPSHWPPVFADALQMIGDENKRKESVVFNRADTTNVVIIGHSMGGAGSLNTANKELAGKLKTVIGMNPYNGGAIIPNDLGDNISNVKVPALIFCGSSDIVASPGLSYKFYENLPPSTPKLFLAIKGMGHNAVQSTYTFGFDNNTIYAPYWKKIMTAWLNRHLKNDTRYLTYFTAGGSEYEQDKANNMYSGGILGGTYPSHIYENLVGISD